MKAGSILIVILFSLLIVGCGYGKHEKLIAEGYIKEYHIHSSVKPVYVTSDILLSNGFYYSGCIVFSEHPTIGAFVRVYQWNYGYIYIEIERD